MNPSKENFNMIVKNYISDSYQKVDAYCGINEVENKLIENNFLVVFDKDKFCGILTPCDLIKHPHKLVIDCLTSKDKLNIDDTITFALEKLSNNNSLALPVFSYDDFLGIIERKNIINSLTTRIENLYDKSLISTKVKTKFLSCLSHEIRTPLNAIIGFLNIISNLDINDSIDQNKEYKKIIETSAERFLLIMNDLIELSLFHSGENIKIYNEVVDIENIFIELKNYFTSGTLCVDKNLSINYVIPPQSLSLFTDGQKLKHILYHLIENATKFSKNESFITFGIEKKNNSKAYFFVTNTGSRIAEENKQKIFEAFEKQEESDCNFSDGLGIGLTVVKNFIKLLGGDIEIKTDNKNELTFYFSILVEEHKKTACI